MSEMKENDVACPLRVALVGSGPAGIYAAGYLLSREGIAAQVDVYERLAVPWGLVRHGVAPDHQHIKAVTLAFEKVAKRPGFRFVGNVEVGVDVTHEELTSSYHAVLYAVGAPKDHGLDIPGDTLPGSHSAAEFVAWYNGHPDHSEQEFDLSGTHAVVVVGNGNVALDVARILALDPAKVRTTDMADPAIEALSRSAVEEIIVLGRRGPVQSAFTDVELSDLAKIPDVDLVVDAPDDTFVGLDVADAAHQRNAELIRTLRAVELKGCRKRIVLRFAASPLEVTGHGRVEGLRIAQNELSTDGAQVIARPTHETELISAQLLIRAIGFSSLPLSGVPFDHGRGTLHNDRGRIIDPQTGSRLAGCYVAGWAKRGPSGVIGTNKRCAEETAKLLLEDWAAGRLPQPSTSPGSLLDALRRRGVDVVDYSGWERLDAYEKALGKAQGRPRVKVVRRADQHSLCRGSET